MRELELKFSVHEPFTLPELVTDSSPVGSVSRPTKATLRATYYDTPDLRLARSGITLRRRTGGSDAGWHLKLPIVGDQAGARNEITAPLAGTAIPAELSGLVTAHVRGARLRTVATLRTSRESFALFDRAGEEVAELVDDTVSVLDGTHVVERFRELEVESKGAKLGFLKKVGAQLEASGAVAGTFMPKAIRALGSRASAPPDVSKPGEVTPRSSAGEVVTAFLQTHVTALFTQDPLVRQGAEDAVHQMRVAARQLRSGLKTFRPLLDEEWAAAIREELNWLASSLGGARDSEVMAARFVRQIDAFEDEGLRAQASAAVTRSLTAAQRRGATQMRASLTSPRYTALLDRLVAATAAPPLTEAAAGRAQDVLPPLANAAWRRLARACDAIDEDTPDETLHRTRILAKQARYASEACALAFGQPAARLAKQIVKVQDVLGEHQDSTIAAAAVQELARSKTAASSGQLGFALGILYSMQVDAADQARACFPGVWREVGRRTHRAWLA